MPAGQCAIVPREALPPAIETRLDSHTSDYLLPRRASVRAFSFQSAQSRSTVPICSHAGHEKISYAAGLPGIPNSHGRASLIGISRRQTDNRMANFEATDSRGHVYTRRSPNSTYTHCVVIHIRGHAAHDGLYAREPYSRAEWAGSLVRAQNNARFWSGKSYIESVDVVEAHVIPD